MSNEHTFDPFALGSGLPLADTNAVITNAEFKFDTAYSADACVIAITFQPEDGGEPQEQLYSVGKNFEPLERGSALGHTSGKSVNINGQSNYGRFLSHAAQCEGFKEHAGETKADPFQAALWIGTKWHLTTVEYSTRNPSQADSVEKVRSAVVPDEFLGTEGN
jgi:hypothetical protein